MQIRGLLLLRPKLEHKHLCVCAQHMGVVKTTLYEDLAALAALNFDLELQFAVYRGDGPIVDMQERGAHARADLGRDEDAERVIEEQAERSAVGRFVVPMVEAAKCDTPPLAGWARLVDAHGKEQRIPTPGNVGSLVGGRIRFINDVSTK